MRKNWLFIILALSLFGCGDDPAEGIQVAIDDTTNLTPKSLVIRASRTYNPSGWTNYSTNYVFDNVQFTLPQDIIVLQGNSGTGWLSLVLGNRKFCYQGNASNNQTPNGTKFILKREKTVLTSDCTSSSNSVTPNTDITLLKNDVISLSVNGGGCSNSQGACINTEVEATIEKK